MAFDAYLKLEGVKGTAQAKGFEKQIEIESFSFAVSNAATHSSAGGQGAGRADVSSFSFMKRSDESSPLLFQACCTGQHFPKASLTLRKAGGSQMDFLKYELSDVFVDGFQWSGSSHGDDVPSESLSLAFAKIEVTYTSQDSKGGKASPVVGGWDIQKVAKI